MEKVPQKDNSRIVLAIVLISIGTLWMLKRSGLYYDFPFFNLENLFYPFRQVFHRMGHFFISWQIILIIVGAILLAGKRSGGLILIIIGAVFILPKIFFFSGLTLTLLVPMVLIGVGVAIVAKLI